MRTKATGPTTKQHNTALVYRALREAGSATAQALAGLTGLSVMTVGSILGQLVADGRALKGLLLPSGGGRPSQSYEFNTAHAHVAVVCARARERHVVVDVRVADLLGQCQWERSYLLDDIRVDSFVPLVEEALRLFPTIGALGFSMPGTEHDARLGMSASDFSALAGTRFSEFYRSWFHLPVSFENDANAAALGWVARHPQVNSLVYLYFPDAFPPGLGFYLNGALWRGRQSAAGEVGRLPLGVDWPSLPAASPEAQCEALARMAAVACAAVDPEVAVLSADFLAPEHLELVARRCADYLILPPRLELSRHFPQDFSSGVIRSALALLEKPLGLSSFDFI